MDPNQNPANPVDPNQAVPDVNQPVPAEPVPQAPGAAAPQAEEKCITCGGQASNGICVPCGQPMADCTCQTQV